ncbi:high affinity cationic amino acid transporter 1-like [Zerene cesonia]|uniref:high affinity cationic amino acid transporter 1-like n=1 Tax=Zerene cesonia TaxID=33412 RepID=UPI0018E4FB1A|nr:high affinity cationic amino acid transporter 1-like [Zerene cesonia]
MGGKWAGFCRTLRRRRVFEPEQLEEGNLRRCLTVWDLTALGLGSTLGVGVYVLVGSVAMHLAGPAIVVSFLIAAVASLFAGMCYAEFGSRVPKAGSAYIYTYVTVGEFIAYVVGWNMILEALFGTASVARGLSMYVDSMVNKSMSAGFESIAPITAQPFSAYFDFFAFAVVIVLGVLLAVGVRESTSVNNAFALVNMAVILFIIIAGALKADVSNWSIPASQVGEGFGTGGFAPYGVRGVLRGAAVCFYGFVGFDTISSTGEEVKDPRRSIPTSILAVLVVVFLAYASVATVVTMMVPYYMQDVVASVASAFSLVGWEWARWIVSVGAVFGISASLFGALFPLPRLLYAMSSDGLLPHWLAALRNKAPVAATLLPTAVIAVLSAILDLQELVMMMCVGTLLSYTIVAACVILLRYRSDSSSTSKRNFVKIVLGYGEKYPTKTTSNFIKFILVLFASVCLATALILTRVERPLIPAAILHCAGFLLIVVMALQPQNKEELAFKTPLVPLIPCLSMYVNINLMILISVHTWIRVLVWIAIGIPIYIICVCCYKRKEECGGDEEESHVGKNGKPAVQIFVESPTPPDTINHSSNGGDRNAEQKESTLVIQQENIRKMPFITEDIIVQHAYIEDNEEKEAKIIDLLDQVIQAEEESYGEIISLKDHTEDEDDASIAHEPHRKSISELSDAGSDASMGNQVLSKYDVIAQVHREDLPRLEEEEEKSEKPIENADIGTIDTDDVENDTVIIRINNADEENIEELNESDNNSRTDESGYSDTLDKTPLNELFEEKEQFHIPVPPPLDENFFTSPNFKKSYTISSKPTKMRSKELEEEAKPRESVQSNGSCDDGPMIFGSDKQINFMSKLNNIFQNKMSSENENEDEKRTRSHSTGNVVEHTDIAALSRERPQLFYDLKKEIISKETAQNLKPVNAEEKEAEPEPEQDNVSLNREELKSKLENIFASGGPQPLKSRLMKSNPPTPEEAYQTDTSSTESIPKMPKMEKNDTLKRQKAKFGEVLNSFRLTLKDDQV